jgi:hypothetical protein
LTVHALGKPPFHVHEVTGLPVPQVAVSVTVVPGSTGAATVFGDWTTVQLPGAAVPD